MAFTNDPTNPADRVRMAVGDTDPLNEYVTDVWYDYYLQQTSNNERLAAIEAAKAILVKFTGNTRERVDEVEIYGNQQFDNYLEWLREFVENPTLSGLKSPVPFAGGISKSDMTNRELNPDSNMSPITVDRYRKHCPDTYYVEDYWHLRY